MLALPLHLALGACYQPCKRIDEKVSRLLPTVAGMDANIDLLLGLTFRLLADISPSPPSPPALPPSPAPPPVPVLPPSPPLRPFFPLEEEEMGLVGVLVCAASVVVCCCFAIFLEDIYLRNRGVPIL